MTLTPMTRSEMDRIRRATPNAKAILDEFIETGAEAAELTNHGYKTAYSCQSTLRQAIKRFHYDSLEVSVSKGRVFLFKNKVR